MFRANWRRPCGNKVNDIAKYDIVILQSQSASAQIPKFYVRKRGVAFIQVVQILKTSVIIIKRH